MKQRPTILIVPSTQQKGVEFSDLSISLGLTYALAVQAAGGLPLVVPIIPDPELIRESVARCDGVLLTGGDDLQPKLYTRRLSPALRQTVSEPEPERDVYELEVVSEVFRQRKPLLAICRGAQILNVALGGRLIVDIPSQVPGALPHKQLDKKSQKVHPVTVEPDSALAAATGRTTLEVNSTHHQALDHIPELLRVTARAPDGVVEAVELAATHRDALPYLLAVQFHPERLQGRHPEHLAIFQHFVEGVARHGRHAR